MQQIKASFEWSWVGYPGWVPGCPRIAPAIPRGSFPHLPLYTLLWSAFVSNKASGVGAAGLLALCRNAPCCQRDGPRLSSGTANSGCLAPGSGCPSKPLSPATAQRPSAKSRRHERSFFPGFGKVVCEQRLGQGTEGLVLSSLTRPARAQGRHRAWNKTWVKSCGG